MLRYIYKLTSPSLKCYVGQTCNILSRWSAYKNLVDVVKSQPKLYNALKKYGPENFEFEIIDLCYEKEELDDAECYWIQYYDSVKNGYNCMLGGSNGTHSEETREKLRISHLGKKWSDKQREGKKNSKYKFVPSKDHLEKLHTGRDKSIPGMLGKTQSENQKLQVSRKMKDIPKSEEHKKKLSHAKIKYVYNLIAPDCIEYITNNLKLFCDENNLSFGNMYAVLKGKYYKGWKVSRKIFQL